MDIRVCVDVEDLERAIAFYTRGLGLTVGRRFRAAWCELLGATSPIDLLAEPAGTKPCPDPDATRDYRRHWTPVHLDFVVQDLEAAARRATEAGAVQERPIQDRAWGRIALFSDPFGNGFCLLELRGRGYDEMLDPT
jgi:predicted enzyme related to lactoylglutathione lyase